MIKSHTRVFNCLLAGAATFTGSLLMAAGQGSGNAFSASFWHLQGASLDNGGDWSVSAVRIQLQHDLSSGGGDQFKIGLSAGYEDHSFDQEFAPWESLLQSNISLQWNRSLDERWSLMAMPSIGFSVEDGASYSDGMQYGAILALNQFISPQLQLGYGFGIYGGLEDTTAFPFLLVRWQINENWYVGNPFAPGPIGPAGLEIGHRSGDWSLAGGAAYRKERFRLKDSGPYADGYGESSGVALFIRASKALELGGELHFYLGTIVGGELAIEDEDGMHISKSDFDPAPMGAISWQGRF